MRKYILLAALVFGFASANAQTYNNVKMERNGDNLNIAFNSILSDLSVGSRRTVALLPKLVNGSNVKELAPIATVYGRNNYYYAVRNGLLAENAVRVKDLADANYSVNIPYESWMNGANLVVEKTCYGCCGNPLSTDITTLGQFKNKELNYTPDFLYVQPNADVKARSEKGCAKIEYQVNKTNLLPNFRNNKAEIDNILALIESVKNDSDNKVKNITIKGFASPEGTYKNNERLAKGRTETLKNYISKKLGGVEIETSYEAEDWEGFRTWVENSSLVNKAGILDIIDDSSLDIDAKEKKIRATYPSDYQTIKNECYPTLRRADYCVDYEVENFTDLEKMTEYVKTQPNKLSLNEFFMVANQYKPGSQEFNDVIAAALKMYPDSEVANLNAANSALSVGDLVSARNFLNKAGNSNEASYARGILETLSGNYAAALNHFNKAKSTVSKANAAIAAIKEVM